MILNIRFFRPPWDSTELHFVEVEDGNGRSIRVGTWTTSPDNPNNVTLCIDTDNPITEG